MSTVEGSKEVLETVTAIIRDVIGEEWVEEVPIGMETSFTDLELESIEIVALGESLQAKYPNADFASWLSGMELDEVVALRVGELVDFVAACR
jgi:acyl carrier protein